MNEWMIKWELRNNQSIYMKSIWWILTRKFDVLVIKSNGFHCQKIFFSFFLDPYHHEKKRETERYLEWSDKIAVFFLHHSNIHHWSKWTMECFYIYIYYMFIIDKIRLKLALNKKKSRDFKFLPFPLNNISSKFHSQNKKQLRQKF